MVILYNPKTGSKIEHFIHGRVGELAAHDIGEVKQYEPDIADELKRVFGFLEDITPQRAQEILAKPKEAAFKCEYCDFSTDHKVALAGHSKTHTEEIAKAKAPAIDPSIVPVATAKPVEPMKPISQRQQDDLTEKDGYYGAGLTEKRNKKVAVMGG